MAQQPNQDDERRPCGGSSAEGQPLDPVEQARRWLLERGVAIPEDPEALRGSTGSGPWAGQAKSWEPSPVVPIKADGRSGSGRGALGQPRPEVGGRPDVDARQEWAGGRSTGWRPEWAGGWDANLPSQWADGREVSLPPQDPGSGPAHPSSTLTHQGVSPSCVGPEAGDAADAPSRGGQELDSDPADLQDGGDADPESVARTIVLRKLSAQARTRAELHKALQAKHVPEGAAARVLDRMESLGLIDDRRFAQDWVESRQQRRHLSRSALRRELMSKGVDKEDLEAALTEVGGEDELTAARALAHRKVRAMRGLDRQVRYRRLAGALGRRGFSPGVVSRVLEETLSGVEEELPPA